MTKLIWGQSGSRKYEVGVDRGVFYPASGDGVAWNGLISVVQAVEGGEVEPFYFEGRKFINFASARNYRATVTTFATPLIFGPALGEVLVRPGFTLTNQAKQRFGFSYRTGSDMGYKLHLVYNATASLSARTRQSTTSSIEPLPLELSISAVPPLSSTFKPTAHFVVDSAKATPASLLALENKLYGTTTTAPGLPTVTELINFLKT